MKLGSGLLRIRMTPSQQPASLCNAVVTDLVSVSAVLGMIITQAFKNARWFLRYVRSRKDR